jgi:hypothetical protein
MIEFSHFLWILTFIQVHKKKIGGHQPFKSIISNRKFGKFEIILHAITGNNCIIGIVDQHMERNK